MSKSQTKLGYFLYFLRWTLAITAAGGLLGAISFPVAGAITGAEGDAWRHALSGARQLGFVAFIWAPGTAAVLCFHRIYRDRRGEKNERTA